MNWLKGRKQSKGVENEIKSYSYQKLREFRERISKEIKTIEQGII